MRCKKTLFTISFPHVGAPPPPAADPRPALTNSADEGAADAAYSLMDLSDSGTLIGDRLACHMVDVIVWVYVIGLLVFMLQKYVYYRKNGMHYFFLDYCYFHNACLVAFLVWRLVDVRYAEAPLFSWKSYLPQRAQYVLFANRTQLRLEQQARYAQPQHHTLTSFCQQGIPFLHAGSAAESSFRLSLPDGIYLPQQVKVYTIHYALSNLTDVQFVQTFFLFFMLFAGAFGPILGAIWMWRNALLFHSADRMSSCYLHLFPAIIQILFLHILFTTARKELSVVDPVALVERAARMALTTQSSAQRIVPGLYLFMQKVFIHRISLQPFLFRSLNSTTKLTPDFLRRYMLQQGGSVGGGYAAAGANHTPEDFHLSSLSPAERQQVISIFANYAQKYQIEALCGDGTLCHELQQNVTYVTLLCLHLFMFAVWQFSYHTFHEYRRGVRERRQRRQREQQHRRRMGEPPAIPPTTTLAEGAGGDLSQRMTAYTWMMEHPPGGFKGLPYRFVTCCGTERLPSTFFFAVSQLLCHMLFFSIHYVVFIYPSFHYFYSVLPLSICLLGYVALCIYNAASMNKKWIKQLQRMAAANSNNNNNEKKEDVNEGTAETVETEKKKQ
ncbi:hypothetical protein STCU_02950 [Strigomonas culicis]|uniref:Glycerophosphocholine acyltransferase 1 n=1 Tax=Strigomonas culicis TaxID=28005 RepID=S9UMU6_9TRYP|nr:hypothetical protein STCU_02950 [Strigomonas culicis]|eukprot:EPY32152.1 hypothetical protein STCU_02950 [Strigomonas culicis]